MLKLYSKRLLGLVLLGEQSRLRKSILWRGGWRVIAGLLASWGLYDLITAQTAPHLPTTKDAVAWWDWQMWIIIALVIIIAIIYAGSRSLIREKEGKISLLEKERVPSELPRLQGGASRKISAASESSPHHDDTQCTSE